MATLDVFRTTVGAAALGLARRALDEALARVKTGFSGKALAEFQLTQARLADALAVDAAALLIYRAAWAKNVAASRAKRRWRSSSPPSRRSR